MKKPPSLCGWCVVQTCAHNDVLKGVGRPHDGDLPLKDVAVVHEPGRKPVHRVFRQLWWDRVGKVCTTWITRACTHDLQIMAWHAPRNHL